MDQISKADRQAVSQMQKLFHQLMAIREDLTFETFIQDKEQMHTVAEALAQIGQTANGVSEDFKAYFNSIAWDSLGDFGAVLNEAEQPVPEIAWGILQDDLPYLANTIDQVVAFLENLDGQSG